MSTIARPTPEEVFTHFQGYVAQTQGDDLFAAFEQAMNELRRYVHDLPEERCEHRYAAGKWSIKEVVQHLTDTERILSYRALRFARHDATELAGFEENDYVPAARVARRTMADLITEHEAVRASTIALFRSFDADMVDASGVANGKRISVRALGWSIAGHVMHHVHILHERYT